MKYIITDSLNAYYNLAFEEYILTNYYDDDYIVIWQDDNTLEIGRNQLLESQLNMDLVRSQNVDLCRRNSGGGAVYYNLGNINFSLITQYDKRSPYCIELLTRPLMKVLRRIGLNSQLTEMNELVVDDKKIMSYTHGIYLDRIVHHVTLFFDSDLEMAHKLLGISLDQKNTCVMSLDNACNIKNMLTKQINLNDFNEKMVDGFERAGYELVSISEDDKFLISNLATNKYSSDEWLACVEPEHNKKCVGQFADGNMTIYAMINDERIQSLFIYGDFFATKPVEDMVDSLIDLPYDREQIKMLLKFQDTVQHLGGISVDEFLDLLFS